MNSFYSLKVKTNVDKLFTRMVDEHFPCGHIKRICTSDCLIHNTALNGLKTKTYYCTCEKGTLQTLEINHKKRAQSFQIKNRFIIFSTLNSKFLSKFPTLRLNV